jgi:hypothetical protein
MTASIPDPRPWWAIIVGDENVAPVAVPVKTVAPHLLLGQTPAAPAGGAVG